jgi:hypothetical protein
MNHDSYLEQIDDEDVLAMIQRIRRRGNLPDIQHKLLVGKGKALTTPRELSEANLEEEVQYVSDEVHEAAASPMNPIEDGHVLAALRAMRRKMPREIKSRYSESALNANRSVASSQQQEYTSSASGATASASVSEANTQDSMFDDLSQPTRQSISSSQAQSHAESIECIVESTVEREGYEEPDLFSKQQQQQDNQDSIAPSIEESENSLGHKERPKRRWLTRKSKTLAKFGGQASSDREDVQMWEVVEGVLSANQGQKAEKPKRRWLPNLSTSKTSFVDHSDADDEEDFEVKNEGTVWEGETPKRRWLHGRVRSYNNLSDKSSKVQDCQDGSLISAEKDWERDGWEVEILAEKPKRRWFFGRTQFSNISDISLQDQDGGLLSADEDRERDGWEAKNPKRRWPMRRLRSSGSFDQQVEEFQDDDASQGGSLTAKPKRRWSLSQSEGNFGDVVLPDKNYKYDGHPKAESPVDKPKRRWPVIRSRSNSNFRDFLLTHQNTQDDATPVDFRVGRVIGLYDKNQITSPGQMQRLRRQWVARKERLADAAVNIDQDGSKIKQGGETKGTETPESQQLNNSRDNEASRRLWLLKREHAIAGIRSFLSRGREYDLESEEDVERDAIHIEERSLENQEAPLPPSEEQKVRLRSTERLKKQLMMLKKPSVSVARARSMVPSEYTVETHTDPFNDPSMVRSSSRSTFNEYRQEDDIEIYDHVGYTDETRYIENKNARQRAHSTEPLLNASERQKVRAKEFLSGDNSTIDLESNNHSFQEDPPHPSLEFVHSLVFGNALCQDNPMAPFGSMSVNDREHPGLEQLMECIERHMGACLPDEMDVKEVHVHGDGGQSNNVGEESLSLASQASNQDVSSVMFKARNCSVSTAMSSTEDSSVETMPLPLPR